MYSREEGVDGVQLIENVDNFIGGKQEIEVLVIFFFLKKKEKKN